MVYACLGMGIWLGYTADRLKDVSRQREVIAVSLRHHFHRQYRIQLMVMWFICFAIALAIGFFWLPLDVFLSGSAFAAGACFYVFSVSRRARPARKGPRVLKRAWVSVMLAASGLWWWPGWGPSEIPSDEVLLLAFVFAACAFWELLILDGRDMNSGSFAFLWSRGGATVAILAAAWFLGLTAFVCLSAGALGLGLLGRYRGNGSGELQSLLGDGVILVTFLILGWTA
jgi:hypothetical protein